MSIALLGRYGRCAARLGSIVGVVQLHSGSWAQPSRPGWKLPGHCDRSFDLRNCDRSFDLRKRPVLHVYLRRLMPGPPHAGCNGGISPYIVVQERRKKILLSIPLPNVITVSPVMVREILHIS